jgi:hypothetical protein
MSLLSTIKTTITQTKTTISLAETCTQIVTGDATTTTSTRTSHATSPTRHAVVVETVGFSVVVKMPLTCENIKQHSAKFPAFVLDDVSSNPDIAGIGVCITPAFCCWRFELTQQQILLAFLITACTVVLLAILAYAGGCLPEHHLRRVDRHIFRANSRNEDSRWRKVIERVMMSLSDQQLVTGLAILVAGYHEMTSNNLDLYHWHMIVWLALLSSSVHIASLTLLRDVFNKNPVLRNFRVAGMLILLVLLATATWPTRKGLSGLWLPAKCCWAQSRWLDNMFTSMFRGFDPSWCIALVMLLFAYAWKLSQLFQPSRSWIRKWLVAKPQAATERLMRRIVLSAMPRWLTWPAYRLLTVYYLTFAVYAEVAESFAASILFLLVSLPYGITSIVVTRRVISPETRSGENSLTFGQLVPLLLLMLPVMAALELSTGTHIHYILNAKPLAKSPKKTKPSIP